MAFSDAKNKFGFGFMRLPMIGEEVDIEHTTKMVDMFIERGFNYFDTAHGYIGGKSEKALKICLTDRYPRDKYILTNKLSEDFFESQEDIKPLIDEQLKLCGVSYFDFLLMHAQNAGNFEKYKKCNAYETAFELKKEGKVKHVGLSFHDKAEVLDRILTEYPEIEAVQIQFNYLDYEDEGVEGRKCYEVCRKHNKPMIIMEPVRGGALVNLPDEAKAVLDAFNNGSPASYAIRYAASFEGVEMVLSGVSNLEQMSENTEFMADFKPLSEEEFEAVYKAADIIKKVELIPCTACKYCVDGCPVKIDIPEIIACLNEKRRLSNPWFRYMKAVENKGKPADCIKCGKCEKICPQHLPIRELLEKAAEVL